MASTTFHAPQDTVLVLADGTAFPVVGNVQIHSEPEIIRSNSSVVPDTRWSHTDSHGHEHRYVNDDEGVPRLPSLEIQQGEEYWCEDCHDFHSDSEWVCRLCGDVVEPGFKPDYEAMSGIPVSVSTDYSLTIGGYVEQNTVLTGARVTSGGQSMDLPPLYPTEWSREAGIGDPVVTTHLIGGIRKAVSRKPTGP